MPVVETSSSIRSMVHRRALLAILLITLASLYALALNLREGDAPWRRGIRDETTLMATVLIGFSCAGVLATLRPFGCRGLIGSRREPAVPQDPEGAFALCEVQDRVAHHPACDCFSSHVLRLRGKPACAGCTGMALGGFSGILLGLSLGSGLLALRSDVSAILILAAAALSLMGILQVSRRTVASVLRVAASASLVTGLTLVAAILSTFGLAAGLIGVAAALAVVGLRVDLSRLKHQAICIDCPARGEGRSSIVEPDASRRPTPR